jgi:hypothetical protein
MFEQALHSDIPFQRQRLGLFALGECLGPLLNHILDLVLNSVGGNEAIGYRRLEILQRGRPIFNQPDPFSIVGIIFRLQEANGSFLLELFPALSLHKNLRPDGRIVHHTLV